MKRTLVIVCAATAILGILWLWVRPVEKSPTPPTPVVVEASAIRVGYLEITPNLPFYTAVEKGLFTNRGLTVVAMPFKTSNELVESLVTKRIDFTTVAALSVMQALDVASTGRLKIYQVNYIPKADPNDYLLVKKDSPIQKIEDLKGKKIALFPGSNFNVWANLIFGEHFGLGEEFTTVSLPPPNHIEALAAGSVDASYCLEPTATIGLAKGVARVLDVGLVCKYIFDPFPVTGNAVLTEFADKNPNTTKAFCEVMAEASALVEKDPDSCRPYLVKYCKIPEGIAMKVKLGHDTRSQDVDVAGLQKTVDIYMKEGILTKPVDMRAMLLYPLAK
jgi:NitT/TauT family transport system substrate-binding protein